MAALLLVAMVYKPHANDGSGPGVVAHGTRRITARELVLVSIAGAIWGTYNGAYGIMFGFAPTFLAGLGMTVVEIGLLVSAATWLIVASIQAGGLLAQRSARPSVLMLIGVGGWAACLLAFGFATGIAPAATALLVGGAFMGLPVGVIMSLPAQVLQPRHRAFGMGLFYVWLYIGHGSLPWMAGWLRDLSGSSATPLIAAAAVVVTILALFALFRVGAARATRPH